jgi:hypothetical protein
MEFFKYVHFLNHVQNTVWSFVLNDKSTH